MSAPHAPRRYAGAVQDAAMLALIERIVRWHRECAQGHARAGRPHRAEREYETVRRIENYLSRQSARAERRREAACLQAGAAKRKRSRRS